jgi:hypothetical protein
MQMRVDPGDIQAVKAIARRVGDDAKKVLKETMNGALTSTRAKAVQLIGRELNLPAAKIRGTFTIRNASIQNLNANIKSDSRPEPLINFRGTRELVRGGVSVKIKTSGGRQRIENAFISGSGARRHVRRRIHNVGDGTGRGRVGYFARLPWDHHMKKSEILTGPRVGDIYDDPGVMNPTLQYAGQRLVTIAEQQVNRLLGGF